MEISRRSLLTGALALPLAKIAPAIESVTPIIHYTESGIKFEYRGMVAKYEGYHLFDDDGYFGRAWCRIFDADAREPLIWDCRFRRPDEIGECEIFELAERFKLDMDAVFASRPGHKISSRYKVQEVQVKLPLFF